MYLHKRFQHGLLAIGTGLVVAGAAFAAPLPATQLAPLQAMIASSSGSAAVSRSAAAFAVSRPVREIPARPYRDVDPNRILPGPWNPMIPKARLKQTILPYGDLDAAIAKAPLAPSVMPPTIQNFEGMSNAANGQLFSGFIFPPDTVGDIGRAHYVQAVNLAVQVFRTDGLALTPPFKMSDLFAALGPDNVCATTDDGDPIVLYDQMADRWLISQFAVVGPPFHQCIAISQTADPTGAYNVYDFVMPNDKFNDYPHFGVWPDGYYMTDNQFNLATGDFLDGGAFAFDRTKMLAGDPSASYIYFDMAVLFPGQFIGGMLPADLDGVPPATPRPNVLTYFTANEFGDPQGDALRLFEFVPNFATPASSTFTELPFVPVAAFDPANNGTRNDIPQPPPATVPSQNLDSISDRVLHRLQYRNFGTHESMVVNHSVDVDPAATLRFGVRYYELRRTLPGGSWTVHEQATQAPGTDTENRWMGSAAMDRAGNLAVGFSVSNATTFPSIRYAGRLATDPPGSLAQGEATIIAGSSSQRDSRARWGDYSSLNVDPVDDCTFWYTTEYFTNTPPAMCASTICWQTRIASFRFPSCPAAPQQREITGQVTNGITGLPVSGVTVLAGNGFAASTDSSGNYRISIPPGTYAMATAKTGYGAATASGVVVPVPAVPNPPNPVRNFQIVGVPLLQIGASNASDAGRGGNANGVFDLDECPTINPAANNIGGGIATNTTGVLTTTTANVTVPASTANYGSINPGSSAFPSSPFVIQTSRWLSAAALTLRPSGALPPFVTMRCSRSVTR